MIEQFHFLRPAWLLLMAPLLVLLWWLARARYDGASWRGVIDEALLPYVLTGGSAHRRGWIRWILALAALLAILALAGPTWEKLPQPVYQREGALVIALDLSRSMNATDIKPSRLARARHKIADVLNLGMAGQAALIVYAADAFTVTPLTGDVDTILSLLPALESGLMPAQGTRADRAIGLAFDLFANAGVSRGDLLLVSDGLSDLELSRLRELNADNPGHRFSVLAAGTGDGGPVPLKSGGFLKDHDGAIVIARLREDNLRQVADIGGGIYTAISSGDNDVDHFARLMKSGIDEREAVLAENSADLWRELGPWLLLFALPLAALAFRRGAIWMLALGCVVLPPDVSAFDWQSLWRSDDQRAGQLFDRGEHADAASLFDDPAWRASSNYRSGDFEKALDDWSGLDDEAAYYNRANALTKLGRFEDALAAYQELLQNNPAHEDARHNKKAIEDWLEQQQQQGEGKDGEQQQGEGQDGEQQQQQSEGDDRQQGQKQQSSPDETDQADEAERQQAQGQQDEGEPQSSPAQAEQRPAEQEQPESEQEALARIDQQMSEQAVEQWLRKIPDDPGGLMRRKFLYQYRKRGAVDAEGRSW